MTLIATARKRKPFDVVGAEQSIFHNYQEHLSLFFKKNSNELHIRDIHILEYYHISEVWGKHSFSEMEVSYSGNILLSCSSSHIS